MSKWIGINIPAYKDIAIDSRSVVKMIVKLMIRRESRTPTRFIILEEVSNLLFFSIFFNFISNMR